MTESMGLVFVLLPGGTFRMGAVRPDEDQAPTEPNVDPEASDPESPVSEVMLDPFFLSKYELTQGQWLRLVGKNPSQSGPDGRFDTTGLSNPVEQVTWTECDLWIGRLDLLLPTEAQWEYGARGGTTTPRWTGVGTDGLVKAANLADAFLHSNGGTPSWKYETWNDGYAMHAPVGSFDPNPFGLHDVLGNVWESCRDYLGRYDGPPREGDGLRTPPAFPQRVCRGGGWDSDASLARSANRYGAMAEIRYYDLGVRPARSVVRD